MYRSQKPYYHPEKPNPPPTPPKPEVWQLAAVVDWAAMPTTPILDGVNVLGGLTWSAWAVHNSAFFEVTHGLGLRMAPQLDIPYHQLERSAPGLRIWFTELVPDLRNGDRVCFVLEVDSATLSDNHQAFGLSLRGPPFTDDDRWNEVALELGYHRGLHTNTRLMCGRTWDHETIADAPRWLALEWLNNNVDTRWAPDGPMLEPSGKDEARSTSLFWRPYPGGHHSSIHVSELELRLYATRGHNAAPFTAVIRSLRVYTLPADRF